MPQADLLDVGEIEHAVALVIPRIAPGDGRQRRRNLLPLSAIGRDGDAPDLVIGVLQGQVQITGAAHLAVEKPQLPHRAPVTIDRLGHKPPVVRLEGGAVQLDGLPSITSLLGVGADCAVAIFAVPVTNILEVFEGLARGRIGSRGQRQKLCRESRVPNPVEGHECWGAGVGEAAAPVIHLGACPITRHDAHGRGG